MPRLAGKVNGRQPDLRAMLLRAGVGQYSVTMSIPYMMMLATTTDPYSQGVIQIIEGLQRLLNEHGAQLEVDGRFGDREIAALQVFAGPRWADKSWAQLYGDVLAGKTWEGYERNDRRRRPHATDGYVEDLGTTLIGDVFASPLPLIAIGAAVWWLTQNRTR